MDESTGSP